MQTIKTSERESETWRVVTVIIRIFRVLTGFMVFWNITNPVCVVAMSCMNYPYLLNDNFAENNIKVQR